MALILDWTVFRATGNIGDKGDPGIKGDDGALGILTLSFSGSTLSLQGNGETTGYIIYNNTKFYMSGSYTCGVGGDGVIIADISQSTVIPLFKKMIIEGEVLKFVDFNTGYSPITKEMVDSNWQYVLIGEFSCSTSGVLLNAILKPIISIKTFLSNEFTSILKNNALTKEDMESWSKAMGCDQYYNALAVSTLFAGQIFTQELTLTENGVIKSSNFNEEALTGFKFASDGTIQANKFIGNGLTVTGGSFTNVQTTGKFISESLETFDNLPDIDSTWGLSQSLNSVQVFGISDVIEVPNVWGDTIAYGNGKYVLSGGGDVNYSTDGITWSSPISLNVYLGTKVRYVNNLFILLGDLGYLAFSTTGTSWSTIRIGTTYAWSGIAYGNGKYVMSTFDGYTSYSTNGSSWSTPTYRGYGIGRDIAFGNGKFVMVGENGATSYSTDGITWSSVTFVGTNTIYSIIYTDKFVLLNHRGYTSYSTTGASWSTMVLIGEYVDMALAYGNGKYIAIGGNVSVSTDGISWIKSYRTNEASFSDIVYANGKFICATSLGARYVGIMKNVFSIKDIIPYLSNIMGNTTPPIGTSDITVEPLLYYNRCTGTLIIDNVTYSMFKIKATSYYGLSIIDTNAVEHILHYYDMFTTGFSINNLTITGSENTNAITTLIPKNGTETGGIGTDANKFLESYIKTMHASTLTLDSPNSMRYDTNEGKYVVMPNGLIIQWGINYVPANTSYQYHFPTSFTENGSITCGAPWENYNGWAVGDVYYKDVNYYQIQNVSNSASNINWIAVGY